MQKLGKEISLREVQQMIDQHDMTGDKKLNYNEFKNVFFGGKEVEETEGFPANQKWPIELLN